jgi:heterodisulfide reductase subunit A2
MKKRIGVYVCHCGGNISDVVNVAEVVKVFKDWDGVVIAKNTLFACSDAAQNEITSDITDLKLDALVVASCSPKLHLHTFRAVAERAGLNSYNYVHVNIREQCSWAHSYEKEAATQKAVQLVKSGIERVKFSRSMEPYTIPAEQAVLVLGAGIGGMRSAISLADMGMQVYLLEREFFIGGRTAQWGDLSVTHESGSELVNRLYQKVKEHINIQLFTGAELISQSGSNGSFEVTVKIKPRRINGDCDESGLKKAISICPVEVPDEFNFGLTSRKAIYQHYPSEFPTIPAIDDINCTFCGECEKVCKAFNLNQKEEFLSLKVGNIIVNTGFDPYEPGLGAYGYKDIGKVLTLPQFKRLVDLSPPGKLEFKGRQVHTIAYIFCVGSRQGDEGDNKYCSRYCCTATLNTAIIVKRKFKEITNIHFTRGVRTYGKQEIIYEESSKQGDIYLEFFPESPPVVEERNGKVFVRMKDFLTANRELETEADLVILVTGMVPRSKNAIAQLLKIPTGRDHFFNEIHAKLRPVETVIDGVLIAGTCQGPKNIMETLNSSMAAAAKSAATLSSGTINLEPIVAYVNPDQCNGCNICIPVCPFNALITTTDEGKTLVTVTVSQCKGCGMCLPVCPEDAIELNGYTNAEMESMIDGLTAL